MNEPVANGPRGIAAAGPDLRSLFDRGLSSSSSSLTRRSGALVTTPDAGSWRISITGALSKSAAVCLTTPLPDLSSAPTGSTLSGRAADVCTPDDGVAAVRAGISPAASDAGIPLAGVVRLAAAGTPLAGVVRLAETPLADVGHPTGETGTGAPPAAAEGLVRLADASD